MNVLLIPLVGPMQSWGTRSRFQERDTERSPSKSGVIGILASALGRKRNDAIEDLACLDFGVRIDREGTLGRDYHTVMDVAKAGGGVSEYAQLSNRYYLSDAAFLAGLTGDKETLTAVHEALRSPVWPPYLGRRSFPPSAPLYLADGLVEAESLRAALVGYPLLGRPEPGTRVRLELPGGVGDHESRSDQPVSYALGERTYHDRAIHTEFVPAEQIGVKKEQGHVPQ